MLHPNLTLSHEKRTGTDVYGKESFASVRIERCAIIRLRTVADKTSVRTDASASRGYADEFASQNRILVMANTQVEIGDKITVVGAVLRVRSKFPRHSVTGTLDHFEIECQAWA